MLFDIVVIKAVARELIMSATLDEVEDKDAKATLPRRFIRIPGWKPNLETFADFVMDAERDTIMYTMGVYIGRISAAWGNPADLVFYHAGLLEDADTCRNVLYRLIMSCWGHGIGIGDDHGKEFEKAKSILDKYSEKPMRESPCHFDQHESFVDPILSHHLVYAQDEEEEPDAAKD